MSDTAYVEQPTTTAAPQVSVTTSSTVSGPAGGPDLATMQATLAQAIDVLPLDASTKSLLKSKTLWAVGVGLLANVLPPLLTKYGVTQGDVADLWQVGGIVVGAVAAIVAAIGRLTARHPLH